MRTLALALISILGLARCQFDSPKVQIQPGKPAPNPICGPNEVYKMNGGCDSCTIRAPWVTKPPPCSSAPQLSCVCEEGFARGGGYEFGCIPVDQCPRVPIDVGFEKQATNAAPVCPINSVYKLNVGCDSCAKALNPRLMCATAPQFSCVCEKGFARQNRSNSPCIPVDQCK